MHASDSAKNATTGSFFGGSIAGGALLAIVFVAGLAFLPRAFKPRDAALVGKPAPNFTSDVVMNEGALGQRGKLDLTKLRGQPVLLDFWASWCSACRTETPIIDKLAQRYKDRGLVVVGVDTSEPNPELSPWRVARGLSYPIVFDDTDFARRDYGVTSLPTMVLVSRTGNVLAVRVGITDDAELEALIKQAL